MFLRNRASILKSILVFSFLSLTHCDILCCQGINQSKNQDDKFLPFLNLFQSIPDTDTLPVIHRIEHTTYQSKLIDSSFYPFVCFIPFFQAYATFKVECDEGFLVCVQQILSSELSDLHFVELLSFNKQGRLLDRVPIPYLRDGCISSLYEDVYRVTLSVSTSEVYVIGEKYKNGTGEEIIDKHHFHINSDATLLLVSHNE